MPKAPTPAAVDGTPRRAEARLTPAQQAELLAALRASPAPHEPRSRRVTRRLVEMGLLVDQDGGRCRLTPAGRDMGSHLFATRVIDGVNARRMAVVKRKAASGAPVAWPFPESHHAW
ncbi:hypothetical protein ACPWT1_22725 [Ramlibacter sp. MMS24-I3-19]|uniref:hypothetical protein n=1 Tax=Ramlibacter sp. MMS24-I3-19 TaxID=3416606 RepID=UPI003CFEAD29